MARALPATYPTAVYHVTCRGNERRAVVETPTADRSEFMCLRSRTGFLDPSHP